MRQAIVNPFVSAAITTFAKDFGVKLERKSIKKKDAPIPTLPVSVSIGMTGKLRGSVIFSMSESMATSVAKALMPDAPMEEVRKFTPSAVGEMANVICGMVTVELAEVLPCDITPPTIISGALALNFLHAETICVVLQCEFGELEMNLAVVE